MRKRTGIIKLASIYIFLIIGTIIMVYPYLFMATAAFKTTNSFYTPEINPIPKLRELSLHVWPYLFFEMRDVYPIFRFILNSIIITLGTVFLVLISTILGGYVLARREVVARRTIILLLSATFMVPSVALLIPTYFTVYRLGMLNTYQGIILVLSSHPLPFLIVYRFFKDLPGEYEDAARIDGASELRILWNIVIPLAMPAISCAGMISFILSWCAFVYPLMLSTTEDLYTLPVSLLYFEGSTLESPAQELVTLGFIATVPVLVMFLLTQRKVFEGFTAGIKG